MSRSKDALRQWKNAYRGSGAPRWLAIAVVLSSVAALGSLASSEGPTERASPDKPIQDARSSSPKAAKRTARKARKTKRPAASRQANATAVHAADVLLCQAPGDEFAEASDSECRPFCGVDCSNGCCPKSWDDLGPIDWPSLAQGEYVGHSRSPHVPEYRLRVDDQIELIFRLTRDETSQPYQLNVGDEIEVEYREDEGVKVDRKLVIQPDGTITIPLVGQVKATRKTVDQLRGELDALLEKYIKQPTVTVTPVKVNTKLEDLRATADSRMGFGGTARTVTVTPEGTIGLAALGSVPAQGLTLEELKREIDERYAQEVEGIEVTPVLLKRAPRYVYVLGEVKTPGRYTLEGPTTAMQALSLAGGWNVGANVRQVIVFRRGDDWRLLATMLDLRGALYGKQPCPADEIWLNDSDIVLVPKSKILVADNIIELVFTRGVYGVFPFSTSVSFTNLSSIAN